jgi:hypothetical protein
MIHVNNAARLYLVIYLDITFDLLCMLTDGEINLMLMAPQTLCYHPFHRGTSTFRYIRI